jgi:hypothetical protein
MRRVIARRASLAAQLASVPVGGTGSTHGSGWTVMSYGGAGTPCAVHPARRAIGLRIVRPRFDPWKKSVAGPRAFAVDYCEVLQLLARGVDGRVQAVAGL